MTKKKKHKMAKIPTDFVCELPLDVPIVLKKTDNRFGYIVLNIDLKYPLPKDFKKIKH